jgi:hypothetical protein
MGEEYFERGGLRWGRSFWWGANATWPFATLRVTREAVEVRVGGWPLHRRFVFAPEEVRCFRRRAGLFCTGVQIDHERHDFPPFILFWTFHYLRLCAAVQALGYEVRDEKVCD